MQQKLPVKLIECPRDAMQGWPHQIPTETKVKYLNELLKVGFDVLDCASFVSAKAIPQMADSALVIPQLKVDNSDTKLLTIIANERGAEEASHFEQITYLGFPFSISETFQQKNTNSSIEQSLHRVEQIQKTCINRNKHLLIYFSMGFGNPYNDPYNPEIVMGWMKRLMDLGIQHFSLADTVGVATPDLIRYLFSNILPEFPNLHIGAHFHSTPETRVEKLQAAHQSGCRIYDSAIKGIGGCPMAQDDLVGNMDTEVLMNYLASEKEVLKVDRQALQNCALLSTEVFV